MKLVECVPNFSEGRDKAKVDSIVAAAKSVEGVRILDIEMDADHHRCVLTFVAPPASAVEAAYRAAAKAKEIIDLTTHKGEHPRMGAVDVIPFIPVTGVDVAECVQLAKQLGERVARELEIPVFLYGLAAQRPERQDLAVVRKGQFEGLKTAIETDPARAPDYGKPKIHATAGAVAIGAREQIINFNVNLDTADMEFGKVVAKKIRTSGGGLPALRAKEILLAAANKVQISTVLTDYRKTSIAKVLEAIVMECRPKNVRVDSTEIIGLVPRDALLNFTVEALKVINFDVKKQVLENQLEGGSVGWQEAGAVVAQALSNTDATPGGGSAACIAGEMGCGLGQMALGISLQSKKLEEAKKPKLEAARDEFARYQKDFDRLAGEDAAAFDQFMDAMKLPKEDPMRLEKMQAGLLKAAEVPLETVRVAAEARKKLLDAMPLAMGTVASDMQCAAHLLRCAALCAAENVKINISSMKDAIAVKRLSGELGKLLGSIG